MLLLPGPRGSTVNDLPQKQPAGEASRPSECRSTGAGTEASPRRPPPAQAPPPVFRARALRGVPGAETEGDPMEAASPAGPGAPQPEALAATDTVAGLLRRIKGKLFTWNILKTIALGQMLSLCICGTAITSQYLAEKYKLNTPMLQSFINYCLLFLIYTVMLAFQSGSDNLLYILKKKWWKYILLGLADVEANYLIVRAYQYTTLTSVQLLDCFGIPVLMALSWFVLYARYRVIHFIAVAVCLLGVGTMVGADILAGREDNSGSDVLIGDILVLLGASLYAVSNVCEEYIVKKLSRKEFLGMVGLFGTIISGIQLLLVEYKDIATIHWDWKIALLFVAFALCMFCLYSFMPLVIKVTSATSVNLGILTADLYSLFFGLFLFGYKFSGLYILSFTVIMVGFILYCSTPTRTAEPAESSVPAITSIGIDNLGLKLEENLPEAHSAVL
ncbi:solute carrier family 35 member F2 isoform X1 [Saccopteryx bilineata]|uniref:solute carrier family 35 member F2 isoform X1 n=1 Tax=Saccopteryx bilineata TaxID=59482 RepID=UPI00338E489E